jgi:gluconate 2-dehydrogenase gamma chain
MDRRDLIKLSAGAVLSANAAPHRFFTEDEFKAVEELTEMIIPADEKSGGAKAAGVPEYIDARLAEAFEQKQRDDWRAGLKPFVATPSPDRAALLKRIAEREDHFFVELKRATIRGYYTSKIGIHDDLDYKGNIIQTGDYAGELP